METQKFSLRSRATSFKFAFNGIVSFLKSEHNGRLHLLATILVIITGIIFSVPGSEFIKLLLAISLVWISEMINSCIEKLADLISTKQHPQIKYIKDVAAGAVLISSIVACVIAFIIFIPRII